MRTPATCLLSLSLGCLSTSTQGRADATGSTGVVPPTVKLSVQPEALDFDSTIVDETATKIVVLSNDSDGSIEGITAAVTGPDSNLFELENAPATLAAHAGAAVNITYAPLLLGSQSTASVAFAGAAGERALVSLAGESVGVALTVVPSPPDFGYVPQGQTSTGCLSIGNGSNLAVTISALADFETVDGAFALVTALPLTIASGATGQLCFSLTPTDCDGYPHGPGRATLVTNFPGAPNFTLQLGSYQCGGGPKITCISASFDFGPTQDGSTATLSTLCLNTGTALPGVSLTIQLSAEPDVFSAAFDETNHPYPPGGLEPGQLVQIDVTYAPTISYERDQGTLSIASNGGATLQFPLTTSGE